jgi:hypothetical protein
LGIVSLFKKRRKRKRSLVPRKQEGYQKGINIYQETDKGRDRSEAQGIIKQGKKQTSIHP